MNGSCIEWLMWHNGKPLIFQTRIEARDYSRERFGYIKTRKDLRTKPHYWRLATPVKILGILWSR